MNNPKQFTSIYGDFALEVDNKNLNRNIHLK